MIAYRSKHLFLVLWSIAEFKQLRPVKGFYVARKGCHKRRNVFSLQLKFQIIKGFEIYYTLFIIHI